MQLPTFWRRASFTVAESAALIGVTEDALRGWLARNTFNDFNGAKTGYRLYFSALDCFYYLLIKHFTAFGVPVRTAMLAATGYANEATDDLPDNSYLVIRHGGVGKTEFESTLDPTFSAEPAAIIPMRALAEDLIAAAAVVHAMAEPSGPVRKIGTVNGVPIKEWRAAVDAELGRMESR